MIYVFGSILGVLALFPLRRLMLSGWVMFNQAKHVFRPGMRAVVCSPSDIGLSYESFTLPVDKNAFITGWLVPGRKNRPGNRWHVLFCHGNGGTIGDLLEVANVITDLGFSITLFDYRGYGASTGCPSEANTIEDACVCYRYLVEQRGIPKDRLIWFGHSLGAAVACQAAALVSGGMLVMEGSFTSIPAMARLRYPRLPVGLYCKFLYDNLAAVGTVSIPVMVVHSREDQTCPFDHGQAIYAAAHEPKCFVEISGGHDNGGLLTNPSYRQALLDYAAEWLA